MTPPRRSYPTDLTDAEWQLLARFIPAPQAGWLPGPPDRRELVNAMAYWLRAGCAWRLLPHDLPPWQTVYHYFCSWRQQASCPLDWRLLLPEGWDEEAMASRRAACRLPQQVQHRPKWQLVLDILG